MNIEVSIIMISYNKYPQNLFTLHSFKKQIFDLSKVEIILVDDASTDETIQFRNMETPFHFKYIRCEENVGRSRAKNIGIDSAVGEVIIFLDVEMMVEDDFIANHYAYHKQYNNAVVSTTNLQRGIYTVLEPKFNNKQIQDAFSIVKSKRTRRDLFTMDWNKTSSFTKFKRFVEKLNHNYPLLNIEKIDKDFIRSISFPNPTFDFIVKKYGPYLNEFYIPWIFCITRNISLPKYLLSKVGHFSEEFEGWGSEDNELGYRLYKIGAKFIDAPNIVTYHQEHSYSTRMRQQDMIRNVITFQNVHPEFDVAVISLPFVQKGSFITSNEVLADYKKLCEEYPNQFSLFKNSLLNALHEILKMHVDGNSQSSVTQRLNFSNLELRKTLLTEYQIIRSYNKYTNLIQTFEEILQVNQL